jgi:hypothetical protein
VATLEKQPQIISSPDNKLQVLNHKVYFDRFGCACVEGAVKNLTERIDLIANLKVDYYDYYGEYINSEVQSLPIKYANRAIGFHIMYSGPQSTETTYYKISFI